MNTLTNALLAYPPQDVASLTHPEHDTVLRQYVIKVTKSITAHSGHLQKKANVHTLLKLLRPDVNTIGYIAILDSIYTGPHSSTENQEFHPYLLRFLADFHPLQVRFVGTPFLSLLEHVARGHIFPPKIAVETVVRVLLRLDPTNQVLTSHHLAVLKLAYETATLDPEILPLLETKTILFPGTSADPHKALCDPTVLPQTIFSTRVGLTRGITTLMALEYYLLAGTTYIRLRQFSKASEYFILAVCYPTRDKSISELMVQAYKRWVLTNILVHGTAPDAPVAISNNITLAYRALAREYLDLAAAFENPMGAATVKEDFSKNATVFTADSNQGLATEILLAYQRRHIMNLRDTYVTLPVSLVRTATQSALTGTHLETEQETVQLIQTMIREGELNASLIDKNGTLFLQFNDIDGDLHDEAAVDAAFKANLERLQLVQRIARAVSTRAETHPAYAQAVHQHAQRVAAGHGSGSDLPPPHMEVMGEEDLMSGVTWS
jgi:COP9 signalosome complex subunit 3